MQLREQGKSEATWILGRDRGRLVTNILDRLFRVGRKPSKLSLIAEAISAVGFGTAAAFLPINHFSLVLAFLSGVSLGNMGRLYAARRAAPPPDAQRDGV